MRRLLFFPITAWLLTATVQQAMGQEAVQNKQRHFRKTVAAGNYSGIVWLGGNSYAVADDKSATAGFHLMTIRIDSITGNILEVSADSFMTAGQPNRDEEGICYVPQWNTVFVSGESDGQIVEYTMDGKQTGRRLAIPAVFGNAHSNSGFEALTYHAATHRFWTTTENTLKGDGILPDIRNKASNRLRLQSFGDDLQPKEQYWYQTDSTAVKNMKGRSILGVSGLATLDDGRIIVLEREVRQTPRRIGSFVHVKLYAVPPMKQEPGTLLTKQLIAEFRTRINLTSRKFANYEGLCVGPRLADGRQVLLLVADSQNQYKGWLRDWFKTVVLPSE